MAVLLGHQNALYHSCLYLELIVLYICALDFEVVGQDREREGKEKESCVDQGKSM